MQTPTLEPASSTPSRTFSNEYYLDFITFVVRLFLSFPPFLHFFAGLTLIHSFQQCRGVVFRVPSYRFLESEEFAVKYGLVPSSKHQDTVDVESDAATNEVSSLTHDREIELDVDPDDFTNVLSLFYPKQYAAFPFVNHRQGSHPSPFALSKAIRCCPLIREISMVQHPHPRNLPAPAPPPHPRLGLLFLPLAFPPTHPHPHRKGHFRALPPHPYMGP